MTAVALQQGTAVTPLRGLAFRLSSGHIRAYCLYENAQEDIACRLAIRLKSTNESVVR
jgi:hypothetical protein